MNHLDRIQQAIDYVESRLTEELSTQSIAANVGFSEYHFHRIFSAVVGESAMQYIRGRRMAYAVRELSDSDRSILDIAIDAGFDTQESFTRAFKKSFGVTPGQCRRGTAASLPLRSKFDISEMTLSREGVFMEPQFVNREAEYAVGLGGAFPTESFGAIHELWNRFLKRKHEIVHARQGYALGVCMPAHPDIPKGPNDSFVYVAALPVVSIEDIPEGMIVCKLESARYAKFTHKGPLANLPETASYVWGTWLPASGYKHVHAPDFEVYDDRFKDDTLDGEFDIYVPIGQPST